MSALCSFFRLAGLADLAVFAFFALFVFLAGCFVVVGFASDGSGDETAGSLLVMVAGW
jgi:hypothetical protein